MAAFLEAEPVFGTFVPGSTVILGLSALAATVDLSLPAVFASVIGGALFGDGTAFLIGHRYPSSVRKIWPLSRYPEIIHRSEQFFKNYGGLSIIFARFIPSIRAFVPFTAGALGMAPIRFFPTNVVAIIFWAAVYVLPGVFAGGVYQRAGVVAQHMLLPVLLGLGFLGIALWAIRRRRDQKST